MGYFQNSLLERFFFFLIVKKEKSASVITSQSLVFLIIPLTFIAVIMTRVVPLLLKSVRFVLFHDCNPHRGLLCPVDSYSEKWFYIFQDIIKYVVLRVILDMGMFGKLIT